MTLQSGACVDNPITAHNITHVWHTNFSFVDKEEHNLLFAQATVLGDDEVVSVDPGAVAMFSPLDAKAFYSVVRFDEGGTLQGAGRYAILSSEQAEKAISKQQLHVDTLEKDETAYRRTLARNNLLMLSIVTAINIFTQSWVVVMPSLAVIVAWLLLQHRVRDFYSIQKSVVQRELDAWGRPFKEGSLKSRSYSHLNGFEWFYVGS